MCYSLSDDKETYEELYTKFWENFLAAIDLPDDIWRKAMDYMHSKETEEFIDMLNELIEVAITHGNDWARPWARDDYLITAMQKIREALGLDEVYSIEVEKRNFRPSLISFKKKEKAE